MNVLSAAVLAGRSIIDIDGSIFLLVVIFFVAFFVLRAFVFKPMIGLFEAREKSIDGARVEAKEMQREATAKGEKFEEEMRGVRQRAAEERDKLRAEGQRLERQILEKVRGETQKTLEEASQKMNREASAVRSEMKSRVPVLAGEMASRVLGREVI